MGPEVANAGNAWAVPSGASSMRHRLGVDQTRTCHRTYRAAYRSANPLGTLGGMLYDDGRVACDETRLILRWYYLWGSKRIPYWAIQSVTRRPLTDVRGRWRIWGSFDLRHYYNLDRSRPKKSVALEIHTHGHIIPTIT